MSFSNKQALIVGGSSGMGMAAARLLLDAGGSVTLVARNKEKLVQAKESLGAPDRINTFRCDLNSSEEVGSLVAYVGNDMKDVKYLINAAGVFSPKPFVEHTRAQRVHPAPWAATSNVCPGAHGF